MGWSDISVSLHGPVVRDFSELSSLQYIYRKSIATETCLTMSYTDLKLS